MKKGELGKLELSGFKSFKKCETQFGRMNILIGANGSGKSNFMEFFEMLHDLLHGNLQRYVGRHGGPDAVLHYGRKSTEELSVKLSFGQNGYHFILAPTKDNRMMFRSEDCWWEAPRSRDIIPGPLGGGHFESQHKSLKGKIEAYDYVFPVMEDWRVYHFHDTSESAYVKQLSSIGDNEYLRQDARNLAAFLFRLKQQAPKAYQHLVEVVQLVAPFFGDFHLRPHPPNTDQIELEWVERDHDFPFKAHHLSDGTLRFICLATLLLQPSDRQPATILIDEPELGLHPYAVTLLAAMLKTVSLEKQVIVSTQSADLLSEFEPEDVLVADREADYSVLSRLKKEKLAAWLEDYSLGDLWKKNLLGGRP